MDIPLRKDVIGATSQDGAESLQKESRVGGLTAELPTVYPAKARSVPDGLASVGVASLHIMARLGSPTAEPVKHRLDSGADITLISLDQYETLPEKPPLRQGLRMKLYHLTGDATILGYIKTTMYVASDCGRTLGFEVEAYVVKNMRVPILLGEDFQVTYELGILRDAEAGTRVTVGKTGYTILASSSTSDDLGFECRYAHMAQSFVRRKAPQRVKAKTRARLKRAGPPPVRAEEDTIIPAGAAWMVKIGGPFSGRSDWLVEGLVLSQEDGSIMAAPTTWIKTTDPRIPIANPSGSPWIIKAGDI
ncbi:hypothetical protein PLICRDRAFT_120502, partial [Plicaturopsis crispa FD-325 SS-3]